MPDPYADGSLVLSRPMWLEAAAAMRTSVNVAGVPMTLIFPVPVESDSPLPYRDLMEPRYRGRQLPHPKFPPTSGWGTLDLTHNRLLVKAVRFVIKEDRGHWPPSDFMTDRPLDWLRQAWPIWSGIVNDWLCSWNHLVRDQSYEGEPSEDILDSAVERVGVENPGHVTIRLGISGHGPQPGATRSQLLAAFACAAHTYSIPAHFDLWMQALSAHLRGRYRQCAIDSCSATEAALAVRLRSALSRKGLAANAQETLILQANGVVELSKLANAIGIAVPVSRGKLANQLGEPRNLAVHAGDPLDEPRARAALQLALKVLDAVSPLPKPETIALRRRWAYTSGTD